MQGAQSAGSYLLSQTVPVCCESLRRRRNFFHGTDRGRTTRRPDVYIQSFEVGTAARFC
jgi:hypothetical protein